MGKLFEVDKIIMDAYQNYKFSTVVSTLNNYCANDLSALYLDITKDRLYVEAFDSHQRRSAQTVIFNILDTITRLMAPILSFLAEEVSDFYQKDKTDSIHLQSYLSPAVSNSVPMMLEINGRVWALLEELRSAILKAIEELREKGIVKHSLEAKVLIYINQNSDEGKCLSDFLDNLSRDFTSSEKIFSFTSTLTSMSSSAPFRSRII